MLKYLSIILIFLLSCNSKPEQGGKSKMGHTYTNALINETSPYLLQHAHNPVNWLPWGQEAFKRAQQENKPVLLSIGYSSCHWCHVMEEESFENEAIAQQINAHFIAVKVDREERPDIDQIYMEYVQLTTGSGGWPMTLFLTPDQKPFFGGTYFPPEDKYGRPGFKKILATMKDYYHNKRDELDASVNKIEKMFIARDSQMYSSQRVETVPTRADWDKAVKSLQGYYEPQFGGIGSAPKFPATQVLQLFLRKYRQSGDKTFLNMVTHSLTQMANGGIYDQIGGGFARYSVDEQWLVPHFEKMLYDNGLLVTLYLDTYLVTKEPYFLQIAEETLQFVKRELTSPKGGFYSSLDADSEGEEGKFYVWDAVEIDSVLPAEDAKVVKAVYGVSIQGNFEGHNILHIAQNAQEIMRAFKISEEELVAIVGNAKEKLLKYREKRVRPGLDDKVITAWNGLMLSAFSKAYQITRKQEYAEVIKKNIDLFSEKIINKEQVWRSYKNGTGKYNGFITDYALYAAGLLDAYEALFDPHYLELAADLTHRANIQFWDKDKMGYFTTSSKQEKLIRRMHDVSDSSIPSGSWIMLHNNLRLFSYKEQNTFYTQAETMIKQWIDEAMHNPYGYASYLAALDWFLEKPKEVVISAEDPLQLADFYTVLFTTYQPNKIVAQVVKKGNAGLSASLFKGKSAQKDKATAWVCQNFICSLPVHSAQELKELIK